MGLNSFLDVYTARARLLPILLVALPIGFLAAILSPGNAVVWKVVSGLLAWGGVGFVLSQFGRDAGLRGEKKLFKVWGGKPTTRKLRHRDCDNALVLARRHKRLEALMGDIKLPSAQEEERDPECADEIYEACATLLRERTRDRRTFDLIFEENCNYGFRRNTWGLRPIGFVVSLVSLAAMIDFPFFQPAILSDGRLGLLMLTGAVTSLLLAGWIFMIDPRWVQVAANAYAERLLEACERL